MLALVKGFLTLQYFSQEHSYAKAPQCAPFCFYLTSTEFLSLSGANIYLPIQILPLGLFFGHNINSWVNRILKNFQFLVKLKNFSVQVYLYSLLSSDYHHSKMDHMIDNNGHNVCPITIQHLLVCGVGGSLRSSRSPFLFQRLLIVLPKFSLQLLSVVKEVHQLNLNQERCSRGSKTVNETFSQGCHMSSAQSGVLPSLNWQCVRDILKHI